MPKQNVTHVDAIFGQIIVARRIALGMSQSALAAELGLHAPALSRLERGESPANVMMITKLAEVLRSSPSSLFQEFEHAIGALKAEKIKIVSKKEIANDGGNLALALLGGAAIAFLISR